MTDDDFEALQEELTGLRAENERLQMEAADAEARIRQLGESLGAARREVERGAAEAAALRESVTEAVTEFRRAALAANPDLPADLVVGESVAEVAASLSAAQATVQQVRERLASERGDGPRVPPGSPARRPPDTSGLTPQQKIAEGLRRQG